MMIALRSLVLAKMPSLYSLLIVYISTAVLEKINYHQMDKDVRHCQSKMTARPPKRGHTNGVLYGPFLYLTEIN